MCPPPESWEIDEVEQAILDDDNRELRLKLSREIRDGTFKIPPLPKVAVELNTLANSSNPDILAAIRLIQRDAQSAAKVLQVASSAAYGLAKAVTDLRRATVRIGINGLRDIAFTLFMGQVFRGGPLDSLMRKQVQHGFVVGCVTGKICQLLGMEQHSGFLCGLMHDVGCQALLSGFARWGRKEPKWLDPDRVDNSLKIMHCEVGALVASRWELPDIVKDTARFHHTPEEAANLGTQPMVLCVSVADFADKLEVESCQERTEKLTNEALVYRAGLLPNNLAEIAQLVDQARADAHLVFLTA